VGKNAQRRRGGRVKSQRYTVAVNGEVRRHDTPPHFWYRVRVPDMAPTLVTYSPLDMDLDYTRKHRDELAEQRRQERAR
jgi:hypothetical protein